MSFPVNLTDARPQCKHCGERCQWTRHGWRHVSGILLCRAGSGSFAAPRIAPTTGMITERAEAGEL